MGFVPSPSWDGGQVQEEKVSRGGELMRERSNHFGGDHSFNSFVHDDIIVVTIDLIISAF